MSNKNNPEITEKIVLEAESVEENKENKKAEEPKKTNEETSQKSSTKFEFNQIHKILRDWFVGKAPALPKDTIDMITKYLAYIQLIPVILAIINIFGVLNIFNFYGAYNTYSYIFNTQNPIILIARIGLLILTIVFGILSYSPLKKLQYSGWKYFYWGVWVNLALSLLVFDVFSILIGGGIGFYVAMQIESRYK